MIQLLLERKQPTNLTNKQIRKYNSLFERNSCIIDKMEH